ncbi:benzoylsuccinyl-CoA thiolase subunit [Geotalea daltonii FRC-32]|uniref:Benzoylsuccinyl-CoA thiolase subunit n=1 Tax=Geotalea daltonii (strain DSM 22248 / JCM 15807 / FRC-32) TaxID=316067 RepID=B9M000_GEODF|nr:OB-fold domain-containing protein [Geotalea daltonii]ACM20780.1 benzoylsuccinyl-CoA thiolase subunit [Geotalea daltonii FRC-32]
MAQEEAQKKKTKEKEPDITFFHPGILEVPKDGSLPYLKGYRCKKCGQLDFMTEMCTSCWSQEFEIIPLSRRGKVYSFSDIYIGQQGLSTPYIFAYVDLPENIRVFAQLEGEVNTYRCDEEVELTLGHIRMNNDNLPIVSYKFKKIG